MTISPEFWRLIGTVSSLAIGIISYFLKRTMGKNDELERDVQHIKETYVTKDEFKEVKTELKRDLEKLSEDMKEIKDNSLSKQDFYRVQAKTDATLKEIYGLLIKLNGGNSQR